MKNRFKKNEYSRSFSQRRSAPTSHLLKRTLPSSTRERKCSTKAKKEVDPHHFRAAVFAHSNPRFQWSSLHRNNKNHHSALSFSGCYLTTRLYSSKGNLYILFILKITYGDKLKMVLFLSSTTSKSKFHLFCPKNSTGKYF